MAIKLKSALKIPRQQLLLAVRAVLFASSLWLLADRDFSPVQLFAFIIIGAVLYFTPVFQTLLIFPSFLTLMIVSPIAMSVFGPQVSYPSLLAGFFGLLFFVTLGIKQVVFINRVRLHHMLHLALVYGLSILFFAAPGGDWFVTRSFGLALITYMLLREFLIVRGIARGPQLKLVAVLGAFLIIEAVWVISLLPIGFINAAGTLLVIVYMFEEVATKVLQGSLNRNVVMLELATGIALIAAIFSFSNWALP